MIALVPFELKKLLIKKSVLGAVLAIMLVLAGLFYANFLMMDRLADLQLIEYMENKQL